MFTLLVGCSSHRTANWLQSDTSGIDLATSAMPEVAAYDPYQDTFWVVAQPGPVAAEEHYSVGGLTGWAGAAAGPWAGLVNPRDCDVDALGVRAVTFTDAPDLIYTTPAGYPGVWVLWAGLPGPGLTWRLVGHDWRNPLGTWVFVDVLGVIYTSSGPAVPPVVAATPPGFAAALPTSLGHSRHFAGDVWDQDPGNLVWVCITPTEVSNSVDGLNWSPAALHGMAPPAPGIAYSKSSTKWGVVERTLGNAQFHYSVDNGATWVAGPVIDATFAQLVDSHIQCDGFGHWVVMLVDGLAEPKVYASVDDGDSWTRIHMPGIWPPGAPAVFTQAASAFGAGQFMLFTGDNAGLPPGNTFGYFHSLRALE